MIFQTYQQQSNPFYNSSRLLYQSFSRKYSDHGGNIILTGYKHIYEKFGFIYSQIQINPSQGKFTVLSKMYSTEFQISTLDHL